MAKFQVNILGCGSATPSALHNPSCQVIDFRDRLMMIDCGEGSQVQMRRMKLKFQRLTDIFISHLHGDHCFGLPGLLSTMALHERGGRVTVHMPQQGMELFRSFINYFCKETPYDIVFNAVSGDGGIIYEDHALTVEAFPLYHRIPCYGYIFREKAKLRHLNGDMVRFYNIPVARLQSIKEGADYVTPAGDVIKNDILTTPADKAASYAYCSDTMFDHRVAQAVRGVDVLYHEATYSDDCATKAADRGHATARQAAAIAAEAGVGKLIIGHYSKRYIDYEVLVREARSVFDNVAGACEGIKIDLL
ncbi:ribonuclease Z [Muribaculaceae bacterium Isolate-104 (HZI)]|nr:ribonuclease Z [Muribaculaceae bacterium Isolate-104 (HZI)]